MIRSIRWQATGLETKKGLHLPALS